MNIKQFLLKQILKITEDPLIRFSIGENSDGTPIFVYTSHAGETIIRDKFDSWPRLYKDEWIGDCGSYMHSNELCWHNINQKQLPLILIGNSNQFGNGRCILVRVK